MSKNKVQFQEGFSLAKFYNKYGKEYKCWQAFRACCKLNLHGANCVKAITQNAHSGLVVS